MENRYKLVEVITQQSIAEDWLEAKKEWDESLLSARFFANTMLVAVFLTRNYNF